MQFILRLTVLGVFATAGIALAISVAANTRVPAAVAVPDAEGNDVVKSPASNAADRKETPAPLPVLQAAIATEPMPVAALAQPSQQIATYPIAAPFIPHLPVAAPPLLAEYEPRFANQLDSVLEAIDRVQARQVETADAVSRLQEQIPPRVAQRPEPPEPQAFEQITPPKIDEDEVVEDPESGLYEFNFRDQDIQDVLTALSKAGGLNILASPSVKDIRVSASLANVSIETALTALLKSTGFVYLREDDFIYVGKPQDLRGMAHVHEIVDSRIFRPDYISATELQKLITPLLSDDVGQVTISSPPEVGIATNASAAGGDTYSGGDVVMVRDYVTVLAEIDELVKKVDRMPMQVAIEATILSVKLDDKDVLGVDFELLRQKENLRITSGTPLSSLASADFKDGLKVGFLDTSLFAFIEALETIGDTTVVASPRVMCLNKQRAEILIGSELGYVSTTVTETAATQAVEFLEVGTHLRIRPYISSDGMVRMEVHPELSTGNVRIEGGFTLPDKDVTQVTTNIMCRSGATMVIGGLIREDLSTSSTQIPVLGNLPYVGAAFRQRTETIVRREIIVLLTPRIVDELHTWKEGDDYAKQFDNRLQTFRDKMTPVGKRQFGERYTRLANAAYAAGDLDTALRYATLAIHFDPLNQAAINLRVEIIEMAPDLEIGVDRNLKSGLPIHEHPHRDYSREGYPWRPVADSEHSPPRMIATDTHALPEPIRIEE